MHVDVIQRTPYTAPLPCFGMEHNPSDARCRACPHARDCAGYMACRHNRVTLDRLVYNIVPETFQAAAIQMDDPELPHLQRIYEECYHLVYKTAPPDHIRPQQREQVKMNAVRADCAVRLFILANMMGHDFAEDVRMDHHEQRLPRPFRAQHLTHSRAVERAKMYQQMCHSRFGTFSLEALSLVLGAEDRSPLQDTMYRNELMAAKWFVRYKIFNGEEMVQAMARTYRELETQLEPEWLALQHVYVQALLEAQLDGSKKGSAMEERHRFSVRQTVGLYKRKPSMARRAWLARQAAMPEVVLDLLRHFGHGPGDFLYAREPVSEPFLLYTRLAAAIRHYHCWLFLQGEENYFARS